MGLIPEEHKQRLKEAFEKKLKDDVRIVVFTQETEWLFCKQTRELAEEVGAFSNKIKVEVYDFVKDSEMGDLIGADMVDLGEFPHLGHKYGVLCVPRTVINEKTEFVGAVPEELFVRQVVLAQKSPSMYV